MRYVLAALPLVLCVSAATAEPVKTYVFTADPAHGFVDEELKARRETVADVRKAIGHKRHAGTFVLVDSAADADLSLEVAWRGKLVTDQTTGTAQVLVPGVATSSTSPVTQNNIRLVLSVRDYRRDVWGIEPNKLTVLGHVPQNTWGGLAEDAVKRVAEWVRENMAQLASTVR